MDLVELNGAKNSEGRMKVLIVEDDEAYGKLLRTALERELQSSIVYTSGGDFCRTVSLNDCDLVLVVWVLPDISGVEIVRWIREVKKSNVPVMFISNKSLESDVVAAFNVGADDYMIKPIRPAELLVRAKALSKRHTRAQAHTNLQIGAYRVDFQSRLAYVSGHEIDLTEREFSVVEYLFRNFGRAVSRDAMVRTIWGRDLDSMSRTVDSHVSRIRRKLDMRRENGVRLISIYSYGYRLEEYRGD